MADLYIDPSAASNGAGTENDPKNTFVGISWANGNRYFLKRGTTLMETITPSGSATGVTLTAYGTGTKPIIDMAGTRASGVNLNSYTGWTVYGLRFINQNAAPADAALRVTGSGHTIYGNEFANCRVAIHVNNSARNWIHHNVFDVGNTATLTIAYGVRLNGTATLNRVEYNWFTSSAGLTYGTVIEVVAGTSNIIRRNWMDASACDGILIRGAASGNIVTRNVLDGDLFDCIALEDAQAGFVTHNTVFQRGGQGNTYPCLKIGNNFGAGSPSDTNVIKNNVFVSLGDALPLSINGGGQLNVFDRNLYWRPGAANIIRYDYFGGAANNFLTLAQWRAIPQDPNGLNEAPEVSETLHPLDGNLVEVGEFIDYTMDIRRVVSWNPPTIGAYEYLRPRSAATARVAASARSVASARTAR